MALLLDSKRRSWFSRSLEIDLRNLLANPLAFTTPAVVILLINLSYLNAIITSPEPKKHLLPIATLLILGTFFSSMLSIPFEVRESYSDRIQLEFGSLQRRISIRILSNALIGIVLVICPYLVLTLQNTFRNLTLDFRPAQFLLLIFATLYFSTTATLIGALYRNYLALSIAGAALLVLQVSRGFTGEHGWAFSTVVGGTLNLSHEPRLVPFYARLILIDLQLWIVVTSAVAFWLNRSRGSLKPDSTKALSLSVMQRKPSNIFTFKKASLALKEITSITAHMKLMPFTILLFAIYPIVNAEDAFTILPVELKSPIIAAMIITSLFSCLISIGAYKLTQEEQERDSLGFGGVKLYRRYMDKTYALLMTVLGVLIFLTYALPDSRIRGNLGSSTILKPLVVILIMTPVFSELARMLTNLKIDVRFFILFAVAIPFGELILSSMTPGLIPYFPSTQLAHFAGGDGLYELILQ